MRCPFCAAEDTKVIDSRLAGDGALVRRRRECQTCSERFTTFESAELVMPRIQKSDGRCEPYNEEKLRNGMLRALERRPVGMDAIDAALNRIKQRIRSTADREVMARQVGEFVMDELRVLDQVAYVRFASVYRSFQDVNAFREEIDRLEKELPDEARKRQIALWPSAAQKNDDSL